MRERCPSARFVSIAILKDHRLTFSRKSRCRGCGVADAIPELGHNVWGVVYEIKEQDVNRLDRCEGFDPEKLREKNAYIKEERRVFVDGRNDCPLIVKAYFAIKQEGPHLPNADYKNLIITGARNWRLPTEYIDEVLNKIKVAS